ncbi:Hypothetical_protein [Hexamita inflata]|uniref:Hypothetical_protein n=1 Tax=Hexamita inflata TaxID=28002 RepID=A0AA86U594_9EUKA|nr:Hypothetical protein HINF_LOCUS30885 [Hexamita inflata]
MSVLQHKSIFPSVFVNQVQFRQLTVTDKKPESICDQICSAKPKIQCHAYFNSIIYPQLSQPLCKLQTPNSSKIFSMNQNNSFSFSKRDNNVQQLTGFKTPQLKIKRNSYTGNNKYNQELSYNALAAEELRKFCYMNVCKTQLKMEKIKK